MTAVLENVNKFSYLGLRRRPTYNEVIGLIKENEALANPLPNRDATFFKASNEGSFFDGLDHLEVLKEQQQRILQRQVQDLLLRQNVRQSGGTYHLEKYKETRNEADQQTQPILQSNQEAQVQSLIEGNLQTIERLKRDRKEQTGIAHREGGFLGTHSLIETLGRTRVPTMGRETITEARTQSEDVDDGSEPELIPDEVMTRQRQEEASASAGVLQFQQFELDNTINPDYWISNYRNMTVAQIKFQLFLRGIQIPTTDSIQEQLKPKGRGKNEEGLPLRTYKEYLHGMILDTIRQGGWKVKMTNQEYEDKKREWKRGKGQVS